MAPVGAFADEVAEQLGPLVGVQPRHRLARSVLGDRARLEQQRRQQVVLVAVHLGQRDRRAVVGVGAALAQSESLSPALAGSRAGLQVADPLAAAVGPLDAGHEARHHRLDLVEDHLPVAASLRQRVGEQVQDQLLVGLAAREDPHVRQRARRQQPAQQVERLCLDRALVGRRGLVGRAGKFLGRPGDDPRQRLRVDREQLVHRLRVAQARAGSRSSSGSRPAGRASARHRRCSAWTAPGRRPAGAAGGSSSGRWRPIRRRCARRPAARPSRRRSRGRSARTALPRARPRRRRGRRPTSPRRRRTRRGTAVAACPDSASSARTARP